MTTIRVGWNAKEDAIRRFWRIYLSERESIKGKLVAEIDGSETAYFIRNVKAGPHWVRVVAVNNANTETDWTTDVAKEGTGSIVVTRQTKAPSTPVSAGAAPVVNELAVQVVMDPPDEDDPAQDVEVIQGSDPDLGQLVAVVPVDRGSETGEQGDRSTSAAIPHLPGRTSERRVLSIRGRTRGVKHAGSAVTVPITAIDYPNHDSVVAGSVVTGTLTNFPAPVSTQRWEAGTYGVRLRENPSTASWLGGWGTSSSGTMAAEPSGAHYMTGATLTMTTYDLGSAKDFWLECYDEAQRDGAALAMAKVASNRLEAPSNPLMIGNLDGGDRDGNWSMAMFRSDGKPYRPLERTRWQYRVGAAEPLGDWLEYVPGVRGNARYIQARMILSEPTGFARILVPYAYVRAWTPHDQAPITNDLPHRGVLSPVGYGGLYVGEGAVAQSVGTSLITVTAFDTAMTTYGIAASVADSTLTVRHAGVYKISETASFSGSNNVNFENYLIIDGVQSGHEWHRAMGGGDIGSAAFSCVCALDAGAVIHVAVICDAVSKSWTPNALNFSAIRVR